MSVFTLGLKDARVTYRTGKKIQPWQESSKKITAQFQFVFYLQNVLKWFSSPSE